MARNKKSARGKTSASSKRRLNKGAARDLELMDKKAKRVQGGAAWRGGVRKRAKF